MYALIIILVIIGLLVLFMVSKYNSFKKNGLEIDEAFSNLDTILEQRYDNLTNLIQLAKKLVTHEEQLVTEVTKMRSMVKGARNEKEKFEAHEKITTMMPDVLAQFEAYPEVRNHMDFEQVSRTINNLEENISAARRNYNATVNDYNTLIAMVPNNILANLYGFKARELFQASIEKRAAVQINDLWG